MKALLITAMGVVLCGTACGEKSGKTSVITRVMNEKFGGYIDSPDSFKGKIGFLNAQSIVPESELLRVFEVLRKQMKFNFQVVRVSAPVGLPTRQGVTEAGLDAGVYVVDSATFPSVMVAPDDRWSLVNVRKLQTGLSDNVVGRAMLNTRARGELLRGLALVCGLGTSQYPNNVLNVTSVEDLDHVNPDVIIMDMYQRCTAHLKRIGVTPETKVLYMNAVRQGWAPAPTNEYQKAAWDKVHSIPSKPIKIEYNEKRDKGK